MAKKRRRSPINTDAASAAAERKSAKNNFSKLKDYYIYIFLIVLAGTPFLVGKYIEFNSPGPFDSGSYVYSAQHIAQGARYGIDEIPSAQPGTLFVNFIGVKLFGFSEIGPKIIQAILQLAAFVMMFFAVRKMCGSLPAVISVTLAAFYLSSPLVAKFGNVKEQFMVSFMLITASCFILRQLDGKWWWALLTGAFAINSYYFKQTGLSVLIALIAYLLVSIVIAPKKWRDVATDFLLIIAGAFIGILPLFVFFSWMKVPDRFLRTLPASVLMNLLILSAVGLVIYVLARMAKYFDLVVKLKEFRHVRRVIWLPGLIAIVVVFLSCMYFFNSHIIVDTKFKPIENKGYMKYYNPEEISAELNEIDAVGYLKYYKSLSKKDIPLKRGGELGFYIKSIAFIKYPAKLIGYPVTAIKGIAGKFANLASIATSGEGYVGASKKLLSLDEQSKKIFRFYRALIVPIAMAIVSILAGIAVVILRIAGKKKQFEVVDRLVIFLAVWWICDMAFVWISPRSYEQYYLPLIGSASILAGYALSFYWAKLNAAKFKLPWYGAGAFVILVMIFMSLHIFSGFYRSPHTGYETKYKRYGYSQALDRVANSKKGAIGGWERIGAYIKERTSEDAKIYVWGWYPGIYVKAQRLSSASKAFEGGMHVKSPKELKKVINRLLVAFKKSPPQYIIDSRKSHFPWTGIPFELWPTTNKGLLPNHKRDIKGYDASMVKTLGLKLTGKFGKTFVKNEIARYKEMGAFRKFVMDNYEFVQQVGYRGKDPVDMFAPHRVFKLKAGYPLQEPK